MHNPPSPVDRVEEGERLLRHGCSPEFGSDFHTWAVDNFPWMRDVIRAAEGVASEYVGVVDLADWKKRDALILAVNRLHRALGTADEKPRPQSEEA